MDLIDKIRELGLRAPSQMDHIQTEEATKNALVLPFINALGYNVFDPSEVIPEFTADIGTKKGEKVDYAIIKDKSPIILFECKWCGTNLDNEHASQLLRYFTVTETRIGVLTNGIIYKFYSDLDRPNIMDKTPFLEFSITDIKEPIVQELKKFSKTSFELNTIMATASELKYMREIRRIIDEQMTNPSEDFVKFFASQVYPGKLTQPIREQFSRLTKNSFRQYINDKINEKLESAMAQDVLSFDENKETEQTPLELPDLNKDSRIVTTEDEINGYNLIKSMLAEVTDTNRINIRDYLKFCAVILDDSIRKPICRLYFDNPQKLIGIFDTAKNEEKMKIDSLDDIYKYSNKFIEIVKYYDSQRVTETPETTKISFSFKGNNYEVRYWKDMFVQICNLMAIEHKDRFEDIFQLSGRKNPLFSKNPNDLRNSIQIGGTDIYAEVGFGSEYLIKLANKVIALFGDSENDLIIKK